MLITSHHEVANSLQRGHFYQNRPDNDHVPTQPVRQPDAARTQNRDQHTPPDNSELPDIDETHRRVVLELLGADPVEIDVLVREAGFSAQLVQLVLVELDVAGRLERHTGHRVSLIG